MKRELESRNENDYFIFEVDSTAAFEVNDYAKLKQDLLDAKNKKLKFLHSETNPNINFRLFYSPKGVTIDIHKVCNSYELAQKLERLPLDKYNQFVDEHFLKIFVCTNLNINKEFINSPEFFRALARRVFIKLTKEDEVFDNNSDLTTSQIAKTLGGILFIVDKINTEKIIKETSPQELYNLYVYSNPNAKFKSKFLGYRNMIYNNKMLKRTDDFEFDNY